MDLPLVSQIPIFVSPEEALQFLEFQKHYKLFAALQSADAFSIRGGSCTIHFDNLGQVGSLDVNRRFKIIT